MKKIFAAAVIAACISASAAAVETQYDSFGFNFSVPIFYQTQEEKGLEEELNITSVAFGIQALSLYTERLGLYVNLDLVLLQELALDSDLNKRTSLVRSRRELFLFLEKLKLAFS